MWLNSDFLSKVSGWDLLIEKMWLAGENPLKLASQISRRGNSMVTEKKEKKTSDIRAFEFISYRYYINITTWLLPSLEISDIQLP
jgi:hypothetical protein